MSNEWLEKEQSDNINPVIRRNLEKQIEYQQLIIDRIKRENANGGSITPQTLDPLIQENLRSQIKHTELAIRRLEAENLAANSIAPESQIKLAIRTTRSNIFASALYSIIQNFGTDPHAITHNIATALEYSRTATAVMTCIHDGTLDTFFSGTTDPKQLNMMPQQGVDQKIAD